MLLLYYIYIYIYILYYIIYIYIDVCIYIYIYTFYVISYDITLYYIIVEVRGRQVPWRRERELPHGAEPNDNNNECQ